MNSFFASNRHRNESQFQRLVEYSMVDGFSNLFSYNIMINCSICHFNYFILISIILSYEILEFHFHLDLQVYFLMYSVFFELSNIFNCNQNILELHYPEINKS